MKILFYVYLTKMIRSGHDFAQNTVAQLSWQVQIYDWSLESQLKQKYFHNI